MLYVLTFKNHASGVAAVLGVFTTKEAGDDAHAAMVELYAEQDTLKIGHYELKLHETMPNHFSTEMKIG